MRGQTYKKIVIFGTIIIITFSTGCLETNEEKYGNDYIIFQYMQTDNSLLKNETIPASGEILFIKIENMTDIVLFFYGYGNGNHFILRSYENNINNWTYEEISTETLSENAIARPDDSDFVLPDYVIKLYSYSYWTTKFKNNTDFFILFGLDTLSTSVSHPRIFIIHSFDGLNWDVPIEINAGIGPLAQLSDGSLILVSSRPIPSLKIYNFNYREIQQNSIGPFSEKIYYYYVS